MLRLDCFNVVQPPGNATRDDGPRGSQVRYDFTPANPDPGDDYDKWRQNALNAMASGDDRGWSLADHVLGIDEGGPAGPGIPGGAAGVKAAGLFRTRQKTSYKVLTKHVLDGDHITEKTNSHFQDGALRRWVTHRR